MTIEQLIEDYKRRLDTVQTMLENKDYSSITQAKRIETKANCYRTFLSELKSVANKKQCKCGGNFIEFNEDFEQCDKCECIRG